MDNSGALSIDEFMSLPELQQNPLVQRVIDIFDADGNGEVDFKEFIHGVSQFSVKVVIFINLIIFAIFLCIITCIHFFLTYRVIKKANYDLHLESMIWIMMVLSATESFFKC